MDENPESEIAESPAPVGLAANAFAAGDVEEILRERGWLGLGAGAGADDLALRLRDWIAGAAALLGPQAADRAALAELLGLIFHYDAAASLATRDAQAVIMRTGAREVIRELAKLVLDGAAIDSGRFKEIIEALKTRVRFRSRELFHPIRLALVGRVGEGELDRLILLLDSAAGLEFAVRVKGTRERMLEFCAALD
jgi:nondiscriminating glutamyl-tRNA synthetase